jgi:dihydroxyacetone kinase
MRAVSNLVSFIKDKTAQNILEASQRGMITENRDELQKIIKVAQDAIEQAYTIGSSAIEKTLKK